MWPPITKRRKVLWTASIAMAVVALLSAWLPYRVAVLQLFFWLGGSRAIIALEYRSLDELSYVRVADVTRYPDDAEVLAFESRDQAKAIPLKRLAWHLVANDQLDGRPIVATYCTMTEAAVAYHATYHGKTLHFSPYRIADNNLVMRDAETGSLWRQFTGEAMEGPMVGARLDRFPSQRLALAEWKKCRPQGVILQPSGGDFDAIAPNDTCPVMRYFASEPFLLQPAQREDARLPRKQLVVAAVLSDGKPIAWSAAEPGPVTADSAIPKLKCYWFAWAAFHPNTRLLGFGHDVWKPTPLKPGG
jgi:hypothetical protein